MLGFAALYFAQGYPLGLLIIALPLVCDTAGISSTWIGLGMAFAMMPLLAKPLVAPFVDRYWRKVVWMKLAQGCMVVLAGIVILLSIAGVPLWVLVVIGAFFYSALCALQDTATDGLAISTVLPGERAQVNAVMGAGITAGGALGGSLASWFVAKGLASVAFGSIGVVAALALGGTVLVGPSRGTSVPQESYFRVLVSTFRDKSVRKGLIVMLIIGATGLAAGFVPLLLKNRLGLEEEYVGSFISVFAVTAALVGSAAAAGFADKIGRKRSVLIGVGVVILAESSLAVLVITESHLSLLTTGVCIAVRATAGSFLFAALYGIFMGLCRKEEGCTQFATIMAFGQIGSAMGGVVGGLLLELGWPVLFVGEAVASTLAIPSIILLVHDRNVPRTADGGGAPQAYPCPSEPPMDTSRIPAVGLPEAMLEQPFLGPDETDVDTHS